LFLLLVAASVVHGVPVHHKCGVDGYNVKALQRGENDDPYTVSSPGRHYKYFFNFCGHAKGCYQQPSCQVKMRENGKEEIATVTTTGELYMMHWEKLVDADFSYIKGKNLGTFTDGLKVTYKIGPKQRSTTILVPCLEKAGTGAEKPVGFSIENPTLHYTMVLPSRHGCALPMSQLPIGKGGSVVGGSKGSIVGLMAVVAFVAYCCAGAWYKRERLGAQGIEMIPHIDSMCAVVECAKSMCSGDGDSMGGMFNKARGVGDDGL